MTAYRGDGTINTPYRQDRSPSGVAPLNSIVTRVKERAETFFEDARGSHAWDHTLRVFRLCRHIGTVEGVELDTVLSAAYLHDIGRCYQDATKGAICHAEKGAEMVPPILEELSFSESQKENIIHCVRSHRFRGTEAPQTPEACVLFDADKLDSIGAVGVARAFLFAGEVGARLHSPDVDIKDTVSYSVDDTGYREFKVKLSKVKARVITTEGKRLAAERHAYMVDFFERFLTEYEGEGKGQRTEVG
ncbi:MAG: HD domain-containing protein [Desulfobacterales bacterium]